MNFPQMNNTILQVSGQVVSSFGDFLEQSRWQFVTDGKKSRDGKWVKFRETKLLQGANVTPDTTYFAELKEDSLKGCWFIGDDTTVGGTFEIRYSDQ